MDEISEEEELKRLNFLFEEHECKGASNAETWLVPITREFWLKVNGTYTWINYCPFCGYKPKEQWW